MRCTSFKRLAWPTNLYTIPTMCMPPSLHTEKSPLLGLQFITSPLPTQLTTRRSQTTPTRQQVRMQNERRQLLYLAFLLAALLLGAPILCIIKESATRLFGSGGDGRADKSFRNVNVLAKKHSPPLLRQSSPSALSDSEKELSTSSSPSLSPTNDQELISSVSSSYTQIQTPSPTTTPFD